ncbi:hypothetical protein OJAV_G00160260 [Oryzias javanicus]|uniref:Uncharacterized protein n=1 Tax=Oryzias javanicus TaxID=123683 RepID=A0A3S2MMM9_ORYJA|nr:hypothetical protein OJAV_G00160260 [Oryzias javanicus]
MLIKTQIGRALRTCTPHNRTRAANESRALLIDSGSRCQHDRRRRGEGGCGEEREGLGRRATFQGRGRRNDGETSVRATETQLHQEKWVRVRHAGRMKDSVSSRGHFQGHRD